MAAVTMPAFSNYTQLSTFQASTTPMTSLMTPRSFAQGSFAQVQQHWGNSSFGLPVGALQNSSFADPRSYTPLSPNSPGSLQTTFSPAMRQQSSGLSYTRRASQSPIRQRNALYATSPVKSPSVDFAGLSYNTQSPISSAKAWSGHQLSDPIKNTSLQTSSYSAQGMKPNDPSHVNQDAHLEMNLAEGKMLVGVFDGHGPFGERVAERVKSVFVEMANSIASASDTRSAFQQAFAHARNQILKENLGNEAGTTATVALIDSVAQKVSVANVGDSTAIVINPQGSIVFQSQDHKPDAASEIQRLSFYGTQVSNGRVPYEGTTGLGLSRAIGDFKYAQKGVVAEPDFVQAIMFMPGSILVVASDGVWDVSSKETVVNMLMQPNTQDSSQQLVTTSRSAWMRNPHIDDITAVVVKSALADVGKGAQNVVADLSSGAMMLSPRKEQADLSPYYSNGDTSPLFADLSSGSMMLSPRKQTTDLSPSYSIDDTTPLFADLSSGAMMLSPRKQKIDLSPYYSTGDTTPRCLMGSVRIGSEIASYSSSLMGA